jgi:cell division protein FtsQ
MIFAGLVAVYPLVKSTILNSKYFNVSNINITGVINGDGERLNDIFEKQLGVNLFKFDINNEKITQDKWIERVEVKKIWPSTVKIIVYENKAVFSYKKDNKCFVYTYSGSSIPVKCSGRNIKVHIAGDLENYFIPKFAEIYDRAGFEDFEKIVLRNSYFTMVKDDVRIKGGYDPSAFIKVYNYINFIADRYSSLEYLDLRVPGRIYAKGVLNEAG